jgi:putative transcriptional regulator
MKKAIKTNPKPTITIEIDLTADVIGQVKRHAAAMTDPDCKPIQPEDLPKMPRVPRVAIIRRALQLSQEDFAARFHIPIGTLRDWEQGRKEPDAAAKAYLRVIAREPETVRKALEPRPLPVP